MLGWVGGQPPQEVLKLCCNFGNGRNGNGPDCLRMKIVNSFLQLFGQEGLFHIYKGLMRLEEHCIIRAIMHLGLKGPVMPVITLDYQETGHRQALLPSLSMVKNL